MAALAQAFTVEGKTEGPAGCMGFLDQADTFQNQGIFLAALPGASQQAANQLNAWILDRGDHAAIVPRSNLVTIVPIGEVSNLRKVVQDPCVGARHGSLPI